MAGDSLAECRALIDVLRDSLPRAVDVAALGVTSQAPYQLLCAREALSWRIEELARNACSALDRDDLAAGALLTRAAIETTAFAWKLKKLLETRANYGPEELSRRAMQLLMGTRQWDDFPAALNVLTSIDGLNEEVEGIRGAYDALSELSHPNWLGAGGLYSKTDHREFITHFGRRLRQTHESTRSMIANALVATLDLFKAAYNAIADEMPMFLSELESIWPDQQENSQYVRQD